MDQMIDIMFFVPHVLFRGKEFPFRVIGLPLTDPRLPTAPMPSQLFLLSK